MKGWRDRLHRSKTKPYKKKLTNVYNLEGGDVVIDVYVHMSKLIKLYTVYEHFITHQLHLHKAANNRRGNKVSSFCFCLPTVIPLVIIVDWINDHQRYHILISRTWECYLTWGKKKRVFVDVITFTILRWEDYPKFSLWALNAVTSTHMWETQRGAWQRRGQDNGCGETQGNGPQATA